MIDVLAIAAALVVAAVLLLGGLAIADEFDRRREWRLIGDAQRRDRIRREAREWGHH